MTKLYIIMESVWEFCSIMGFRPVKAFASRETALEYLGSFNLKVDSYGAFFTTKVEEDSWGHTIESTTYYDIKEIDFVDKC